MRALVVEDDGGIAQGVRAHLGAAGWAVDVAGTVHAGWAALCAEPFDVLLLDLGLPDGEGSVLLRRVRGAPPAGLPRPDLPVLIMTARDQVPDRIAGLDLGADDYLTKPFDAGELAARMRALRRRAQGRAEPVLLHGALTIDPAARTVTQAGRVVELSGREFAVLLALVEASPRVLSRAQIEARLYSFEAVLESNAIEVHIHRLRRKLGDGVIRTVRGVGYFAPAA